MIGKKNSSSRLRHRMTLQQETLTADDAGGFVRSWQTVAEVWAEITSIAGYKDRGTEKLFAGQLQSEKNYKITLRYRNDVTTSHRLVFENRAFNIRYVSNRNEDDEILEIFAEEGVAN